MKLEYMKIPLHRYTFRPKPLREWVESHCIGRTLNVFAGPTKLDINEIRNDLSEEFEADYHLDAVKLVETLRDKREEFDTILLDPPYGYRKSMEKYNGKVVSQFNKLKDLLPTILKDNGKVITFGYHSISMGEGRNFEVEKVLLMYHGGAIHDTIATIEKLK
jgi:tRNA G10  N-methylase Trm11